MSRQDLQPQFSTDAVIEVDNVSKKFCHHLRRSMFYGTLDMARSMCGIRYDRGSLRKAEFWALQNVSFDLRRGETLGIIGQNGCGKSTLLRLLNGIFPPDVGRITVKGRVSALIAIGAGFHPHMTGRENIYLNAAILGMTGEEIRSRFDEIVDFAEIGDFIDSPVSTYSSGMYVRLGFAIAVHSYPDILLVDEILSVGDLSFQNKCLRKIFDIKKRGTSIIFVSHAIDSVRIVADRILLVDHGEVVHLGDKDEGIMKYYALTRGIKLQSLEHEKAAESSHTVLADFIDFMGVGIMGKDEKITKRLDYGEDINVVFEFLAKRDIDYPAIAIGIKDDRSFNIVYAYNLNYKSVLIPPLKEGKVYKLKVRFKNPNIKPGVYGFNLLIADAKSEELYLNVQNKKTDGFAIEDHQSLCNFIIDGYMYPNNAVMELESEWDVVTVDSCEQLSAQTAVND
jgi:lipopolysaccharide transport system ATP-binding protein